MQKFLKFSISNSTILKKKSSQCISSRNAIGLIVLKKINIIDFYMYGPYKQTLKNIKNYMIISMDAEEVFDKIQYHP